MSGQSSKTNTHAHASLGSKVQVSRAFLDGVWLLLDSLKDSAKDQPLDSFVSLLCERLQAEVDEKYLSLERRATFTAYKTASFGSIDRESLRKAYLDAVGIHKDWRSNSEIQL